MTRTFPHTWGGHGILITTFALTFNATPLAPPPQAGRRLGILYHPLSPCILSCGFSPFLLLFFFFSFGLLTGRFSAATHPRSWGGGGGAPGGPFPAPPPVLLVLSYLSLSFLKLRCMLNPSWSILFPQITSTIAPTLSALSALVTPLSARTGARIPPPS